MHRIEVAVVGGGVVGLACALEFARRGVKSVAVFDKGRLGQGNTRLSGAIVRHHDSHPDEVSMTVESLPFFKEYAEECQFQQTGFVLLAGQDHAEVEREALSYQKLGVESRLLDAAELGRRQPGLNLEGIQLGVYEPEGGYCDPVKTCKLLHRLGLEQGVEFHEKCGVEEFSSDSDGVTFSAGDKEWRADHLVLATGPWTRGLLPEAPIDPRRGQIAFFQQAPVPCSWAFIDTTTGLYGRPHASDRMLSGLGAWPFEPVQDSDRYRRSNDPDYLDELGDTLAFRWPKVGRYLRGHAGIYDVTPDWRCLLDRVPGHERLFICAGMSGTGFKKAPALARRLADLVLEDRRVAETCWARLEQGDTVIHAHHPSDLPLHPIEPSWVRAGEPKAHCSVLTRIDSDTVTSGIWTCEPGEFEWHFSYDEMIYLLEGRVTIRELNGAHRVFDVKAGEMVTFPSGAATYWTVQERVKKFFVTRSTAEPEQVTWLPLRATKTS